MFETLSIIPTYLNLANSQDILLYYYYHYIISTTHFVLKKIQFKKLSSTHIFKQSLIKCIQIKRKVLNENSTFFTYFHRIINRLVTPVQFKINKNHIYLTNFLKNDFLNEKIFFRNIEILNSKYQIFTNSRYLF